LACFPSSPMWLVPWLFERQHPHPRDSLEENITSSFMETLASSIGTHVKGGRWKNTSKGKGKLKEKMNKPPSSNVDQDAFIEVPLNHTIEI